MAGLHYVVILSPHLGEGYNFLGAFGRCARTNGFCVTEILSTA